MILETNATLHDVTLVGEMWAGDERLGEVRVFAEPTVELIWRNRKPVVVNVGKMPSGVEMIFKPIKLPNVLTLACMTVLVHRYLRPSQIRLKSSA